MTSAEFNSFEPKFQEDVVNTAPNGQTQSINKWDCATPECAEALASVLEDLNPEIVMDHPHGKQQTGGGWSVSTEVPWLKFENDMQAEPPEVQINAGRLAAYWDRGYPPDAAERDARMEIQQVKTGPQPGT